jgi:hypothetical protein
MSKIKKCSKCDAEKDISEFYLDRRKGGKFRAACKECVGKKGLEYRALNKQKRKAYDQKNKEKTYKIKKEYTEKNKEKIRLNKKRYYQENKERIEALRKKNNMKKGKTKV